MKGLLFSSFEVSKSVPGMVQWCIEYKGKKYHVDQNEHIFICRGLKPCDGSCKIIEDIPSGIERVFTEKILESLKTS